MPKEEFEERFMAAQRDVIPPIVRDFVINVPATYGLERIHSLMLLQTLIAAVFDLVIKPGMEQAAMKYLYNEVLNHLSIMREERPPAQIN